MEERVPERIGRRRLVGRRARPGAAPGSVEYTGRHAEPPTLNLIVYGPEGVEERSGLTADEAVAALRDDGDGGVRWLDVVGLQDAAVLERIGEALGLHPLLLEDIANVGQRPKTEGDEAYRFLVLRMLRLEGEVLDAEQLSLVLAPGRVVTFQERPGDVFAPVRQRLRNPRSRFRRYGADYLAYALLDVVIDQMFVLLEHYGVELEAVEDDVFDDPRPELMQRLNALRHEALQLRRVVWPTRDVVAALMRDEETLIGGDVRAYLRDAHDHAVQAVDGVESLRELLTSLHDAYLSSLSHRMNEVMKVLTMIATIFIPLSFVAGVYGMNFDHMPELGWRWSYPLVLLGMAGAAAAMLRWFRRRGWL